jgi:diguanylate cyclase (GGDEF)-like protein
MLANKSLTGRVIIIDDEPLTAEVLSEFLKEAGHAVTMLHSGTEAMQHIQENVYDVILTDLLLPDLGQKEGGLQILELAKQLDTSIEVIIVTGHGTLHAIKQAIRLGAYDLIIKPFDGAEVVQSVSEAIVKRRQEIKRDQLVREVEQVRAEHKELFDLATRDGLTNLYNYRYLQMQLQGLMNQRTKPPLSLAMIDLDKFKTYNDRYGHLKGNEILREIANLLSSNIRPTDIAARYGGDEFVLLLTNTTQDQATAFAERCMRLIRDHSFVDEDIKNMLTISVGTATYPDDADDPQGLIAKADARMYLAKRAGGDRVCVADC